MQRVPDFSRKGAKAQRRNAVQLTSWREVSFAFHDGIVA